MSPFKVDGPVGPAAVAAKKAAEAKSAEAKAAPEAFLTSTTSYVRAVVGIDGAPVADGKPGPVTLRLRELYLDFCRGMGANA